MSVVATVTKVNKKQISLRERGGTREFKINASEFNTPPKEGRRVELNPIDGVNGRASNANFGRMLSSYD